MNRCPIVPRRLITLRFVVVTATTTLACVLLPALAACRPAPMSIPTRPPISWPSPWPSATRAPSAAPMSTPTPTERPTVDPVVALPVAMTLDDARAQALAWLDPTREPRIEWSGYVARADIVIFGASRACLTDDLWRVGPEPDYDLLPDVGIVVIASTRGLSMGLERSHGGGPDIDAADGCNSAEQARERIVGLFDAQTGRRLVVTMASWMNEDVLAAWRTGHPRVRFAPLPTSLSTPAPSAPPSLPTRVWATPIGPSVDRDSVPPAFRDTLIAYPLLPGSRWTWRAVSRFKGVAWQSSLLTETVEAAWLVAPDRLAVRSVRRRTVLHAGLTGGHQDGPAEEELWRLVLPEGFVAFNDQPVSMRDSYGNMWYEADRLRPGFLMEGWAFPHDRITAGSAVWDDADISVVTPAGRFEGCRQLHVLGGAAWGSTRAFCPGVGYVTTDSGACSMCTQKLGTMDLVGYKVEPPR